MCNAPPLFSHFLTVQIVDDVLNLARADYVNYTLALGVVQYLENETNYIPWLAALNNLNFVSTRLSAENLTLYQVSDSWNDGENNQQNTCESCESECDCFKTGNYRCTCRR